MGGHLSDFNAIKEEIKDGIFHHWMYKKSVGHLSKISHHHSFLVVHRKASVFCHSDDHDTLEWLDVIQRWTNKMTASISKLIEWLEPPPQSLISVSYD